MVGRNRRTASAAAAIAGETGSASIDAFPADMSSQANVRKLAAAVLDAYPRLDVLVNNVGGFWAARLWKANSELVGLAHP